MDEKNRKIHIINNFCDWLKDKAIDNILDDKQESFTELRIRYISGLENDGIDGCEINNTIMTLFKDERDFYKEFVEDTFDCMDITEFSKDGKELDELELTNEQLKNITNDFRVKADDLICDLDNLCIDTICEELGKDGIIYC